MANLNTLYCSECGSSDVQIQAWVDANTHEYESSVNNPLESQDCWCNDCEDHVNLATLPELWAQFGDVPVNKDDEIEEDFLCFEKGTSKFDVWHWFDDRCPNNLHDDLMFNNNEED